MTQRAAQSQPEARWRGVAVSEGSAAGRVLRLHANERRQEVYRIALAEGDLGQEVRRFRAALRLARRQLRAIKSRAARALGTDHAYIFDAHILMLQDRRLREDVEAHIRRERANAEWAVKVVTDQLLAAYAEIKDDYLRSRGTDVEDVVRRVLSALDGEQPHSPRPLPEDAIIVTEELMPSAAVELDFSRVRGIASDAGGWTSHAAIIARGLGIPAVVGLRDFYRSARTGDSVVVDARQGVVVLHPAEQTSALYRAGAAPVAGAKADEDAGEADDGRRKILRTIDGAEIILRANVELPAEYQRVRTYAARGIGLFRSEFLLAQRGRMPTEDEQFAAYREVGEVAGADGAAVRLFDLGADKIFPGQEELGRNPALGLRAIRFCLENDDVLRTQVRAVLRAAATTKLSLVLPMISDITDVRRARRVIDEERENLNRRGRASGAIKVGAMVEVPSAVLVADKLAREVDFFSLGTNDLVQYTLAVDRGNGEVAAWFRSLHPSVLRSISLALEAARAASIPAVVCGEMAATPVYALVLIGLGARDLSMTASSIPRVRRVVAGVSAARARKIAEECLACATADDAEEIVRARLGEEWPTLFLPETLPAAKSAT